MALSSLLPARLAAEFFGTFFLCFTVGCCLNAGAHGEVFKTFAVTAIAFVLTVSVYALAPVSGAHFNPAVSLSLFLVGKFEGDKFGLYALTQMSAGLLAGVGTMGVYGRPVLLQPGAEFGWASAAVAEILFTFMLCFVVMNVTLEEKQDKGDQYAGLAIGFVIIAAGYACGHISGAALNPAVALAVANPVASLGEEGSGMNSFLWLIAYTAWQCAGAAMAALVFLVVRTYGTRTLRTKLVAEFIGSFFLVLTVGLNVLGNSRAAPWSIAATLMCMIYALGDISGGHFNPAVTVAVVVAGRDKVSGHDAGLYALAQCLAGIVAGFVVCGMEYGKTFSVAPGTGHTWFQAMLAEFFFTLLLALVVLSVATIRTPLRTFAGLAIASCVTAGGFAVGKVSGAYLNPAVALGVALADLIHNAAFHQGVVYAVMEILGGVAGAALFKMMRPGEYSSSKGGF